MSKNFEIFPTTNTEIKCNDLIKTMQKLYKNIYSSKELINHSLSIYENNDSGILVESKSIPNCEGNNLIVNINNEGELLIFYNRIDLMDIDFWSEEIKCNQNAKQLKDMIEENIKLGYHWSIKKTIGQPRFINKYFVLLAIALSELSNGFVYSDDGAWDYTKMPANSECMIEMITNDIENKVDFL